MKHLVPFLLAAAACAQPPAEPAPVFSEAQSADLVVWAADRELHERVQVVAERIERATGLVVVASAATWAADGGVPLFWSPRGSDEGWLGLCEGDWLAVDPAAPYELRETIVLHEILHALGAQHVETGEGVLSPRAWTGRAWPITGDDVEAICAVRDCTVFAPEVP